MICCIGVALGIAVYLHRFAEFTLFLAIFILLRTYTGGIHLKNFWSCFICSVIVQIGILLGSDIYQFSIGVSLSVIGVCLLIIFLVAPVESVNRLMGKEEKQYCRQALLKIIIGIIVLTLIFAMSKNTRYISLIADTLAVIVVSAGIGLIKLNIESNRVEK